MHVRTAAHHDFMLVSARQIARRRERIENLFILQSAGVMNAQSGCADFRRVAKDFMSPNVDWRTASITCSGRA